MTTIFPKYISARGWVAKALRSLLVWVVVVFGLMCPRVANAQTDVPNIRDNSNNVCNAVKIKNGVYMFPAASFDDFMSRNGNWSNFQTFYGDVRVKFNVDGDLSNSFGAHDWGGWVLQVGDKNSWNFPSSVNIYVYMESGEWHITRVEPEGTITIGADNNDTEITGCNDDVTLRVTDNGVNPNASAGDYVWEVSTDDGATWHSLGGASDVNTVSVCDMIDGNAKKYRVAYGNRGNHKYSNSVSVSNTQSLFSIVCANQVLTQENEKKCERNKIVAKYDITTPNAINNCAGCNFELELKTARMATAGADAEVMKEPGGYAIKVSEAGSYDIEWEYDVKRNGTKVNTIKEKSTVTVPTMPIIGGFDATCNFTNTDVMLLSGTANSKRVSLGKPFELKSNMTEPDKDKLKVEVIADNGASVNTTTHLHPDGYKYKELNGFELVLKEGVTNVTYILKDDCGNRVECSQKYRVVPNPKLTCDGLPTEIAIDQTTNSAILPLSTITNKVEGVEYVYEVAAVAYQQVWGMLTWIDVTVNAIVDNATGSASLNNIFPNGYWGNDITMYYRYRVYVKGHRAETLYEQSSSESCSTKYWKPVPCNNIDFSHPETDTISICFNTTFAASGDNDYSNNHKGKFEVKSQNFATVTRAYITGPNGFSRNIDVQWNVLQIDGIGLEGSDDGMEYTVHIVGENNNYLVSQTCEATKTFVVKWIPKPDPGKIISLMQTGPGSYEQMGGYCLKGGAYKEAYDGHIWLRGQGEFGSRLANSYHPNNNGIEYRWSYTTDTTGYVIGGNNAGEIKYSNGGSGDISDYRNPAKGDLFIIRTATDHCGRQDTTMVTFTFSEGPKPDTLRIESPCSDLANGKLSVNVSEHQNKNGKFTYMLLDSLKQLVQSAEVADTSYVFENVKKGEYYVTIADEFSCTSDTIKAKKMEDVKIDLKPGDVEGGTMSCVTTSSASTVGANAGQIEVNIKSKETGSSTFDFKYEWKYVKKGTTDTVRINDNSDSLHLFVDSAGTYTFYRIVEDKCGSLVKSADVDIHVAPKIEFTNTSMGQTVVTQDRKMYVCEGSKFYAPGISVTGEAVSTSWQIGKITVLRDTVWRDTTFINGDVLALKAGTYYLRYRAENECEQGYLNLTLMVRPLPEIDVDTVNKACANGSTSVAVKITKETEADYTYSISGKAEASHNNGNGREYSFSGLTLGDYVATVRDKNGCESEGKSFKVVDYTANDITPGAIKGDTVCKGANVSIENMEVAQTGAGVKEYEWSYYKDGAKVGTITRQTEASLTGWGSDLDVGEYEVVRTAVDECGNRKETRANVKVLPLPVIDVAGVNKACANDSTNVTVRITTTTEEKYTYIINGATSRSVGDQTVTSYKFTGLSRGNYTATVRDTNGCVSNEGSFKVVDYEASDISVGAIGDATICRNSALSVLNTTLASSGADIIGYGWSYNDGTKTDAILGQTEASLTNWENTLGAGDYVFVRTAFDRCGNKASAEANVKVNGLPALKAVSDVKKCATAKGSATVGLNARTTNDYTYSLSNVASSGAKSDTSHTFENLAAGEYTAKVTDGNGCVSDGVSVKVVDYTANDIKVGRIKGDTICYENVLRVASDSVAGSGADIKGYEWSYYNKQDATNVHSISGETAEKLSDWTNSLDAGEYVFMRTAVDKCENKASVSADVKVNKLPELEAVADIKKCATAKDSATVVLKERTRSNYIYKLSNGDESAEIDDTTYIFKNLDTGNYTATVTDGNGCKSVGVSVKVENFNGITPGAIGAVSSELCYDGSGVNVRINNQDVAVSEASTFRYLWRYKKNGAAKMDTISGADGAELNESLALEEGETYSFERVAVDSCGSAVATGDVRIKVNRLPRLTASADAKTCAKASAGTIKVSAEDGNPGYTFSLTDTTGVSNITGATSGEFGGLKARSYTVKVVDAKGCEATQSVKVETFPAVEVNVADKVAVDVAYCFGADIPAIKISDNITTTSGSLDYLWVDENKVETKAQSITPSGEVGTHIYKAYVIDACGDSTAVGEAKIVVNALPEVAITSAGYACEADVAMEATNSMYSYKWYVDGVLQTGAESKDFTLAYDAGYMNGTAKTVKVEMNNSICKNTDEKTVTFYKKPTFSLGVPTDVCPNATGNVNANGYAVEIGSVEAYSNDYSVVWNGAVATADKNKAVVEKAKEKDCGETYNYSAQVSNDKCSSEVVSQEFKTTASNIEFVVKNSTITISGENCKYVVPNVIEGNVNASSLCGEVINDFSQSPAPNAAIMENTTVIVTATDWCGATATTQINIVVPKIDLEWDANGAYTKADAKCKGSADGEIALNVTASNSVNSSVYLSKVTYTLLDSKKDTLASQTGNRFVGLSAGTYFASVRDSNGCSVGEEKIEVGEPDALELAVTKTAPKVCADSATGVVAVEINGGSKPFGVTLKKTGVADKTINVSEANAGKYVGSFDKLGAGDYKLFVKDANNCVISKDSTFRIETFRSPELEFTTVSPVCAKPNGGSYNVGVNVKADEAGTYAYKYEWSGDAADNNAATSTVASACSGTKNYGVTVTNETTKCKATLDGGKVEITESEVLFPIGYEPEIVLGAKNCEFVMPNVAKIDSLTGKAASTCDLDMTFTKSGDVSINAGETKTVVLTATNSCGVSANLNVKITAPKKPEIDFDNGGLTATHAGCHDEHNGEITVKISDNGAKPFVYAVGADESGETNALTYTFTKGGVKYGAGTYSVTVTDSNGCDVKDDIVINDYPEFSAGSIVNNTVRICVGTSGKTIESAMDASDGANKISYKWFVTPKSGTVSEISGATGASYSVADTYYNTPGKYSFKRVAYDSCASGGVESVGEFVLIVDAMPDMSVAKTNFLCENASGNTSVTLTAVSNTEYKYQWYEVKNGGEEKLIGETANILTINREGDFFVEITNGECENRSTSQSVTKSVLPEIELADIGNQCPVRVKDGATYKFGSYDVSVSVTNAQTGDSYSYEWGDDAVKVDANSTKVVSACSGKKTYSVKVTNALTGCYREDSKSFNITAPTLAFEAASYADTILKSTNCSFSIPNFKVGEGRMIAAASCGSTTYDAEEITYSQKQDKEYDATNSTEQKIVVTMEATDFCGQEVSATRNVIVPARPTISFDASSSKDSVCAEGNTTAGVIKVNVSGTEPYTYTLYKDSVEVSGAVYDASNGFTGLVKGSYKVKIVDGNGCAAETNSGMKIEEFKRYDVALSVDGPLCSNESGAGLVYSATVNGQTTGYTFAWSEDGSFTGATYSAEAGKTVAYSDSTDFTKVWYVKATDANECISANAANVSGTIYKSPEVTMTGDDATLCDASSLTNTSITLTASPDSTNYSYQWSDKNGEIAGANSNTYSVSAEGVYSVVASEAHGALVCRSASASSRNITVNPSPVVSISTIKNTCANSDGVYNVTASPNDAVGTYNYAWTGATVDVANNSLAKVDVNDHCKGTYPYSVEVEIAATGCKASASGTLNITETTIDFRQAAKDWAANNKVVAEAMGGCSYVIPDIASDKFNSIKDVTTTCGYGDTEFSIKNFSSTTPMGSQEETITVVATNGCTQAELEVVVERPVAFNWAVGGLSQDSVVCYGGDNGAIKMNIVEGVAPYKYEYKSKKATSYTVYKDAANNSEINDKEIRVEKLTAGTYEVQVTDKNGCKVGPVEVEVYSPKELTISATATSASVCADSATAKISVTVSGGVPPYNVVASDGANSHTITVSDSTTGNNTGVFENLPAGTYTLSVNDKHNCSKIYDNTVQITTFATPEFNYSVAGSDTCGGTNQNLKLTIQASNGTAPYSYSYNGGTVYKANADTTITEVGTHTVSMRIKDANGCPSDILTSKSHTIHEALSITLAQDGPKCKQTGTEQVTLTANVKRGSDDITTTETVYYDFVKETATPVGFTNTSNTKVLSSADEGEWMVVAKDANNCEVSAEYQAVHFYDVPTISLSEPTSLCPNVDGVYDVNVAVMDDEPNNSATPFAYTYTWTGATADATIPSKATTTKLSDICSGQIEYAVKVTNDITGCYAEANKSLAVSTQSFAFTQSSYDDITLKAENCEFKMPDFTNTNAMVATSACGGINYDGITYSQSPLANETYKQTATEQKILVTMTATDLCKSITATRYVIIPAKPTVDFASSANAGDIVDKVCENGNTNIGKLTVTATGTSPYTFDLYNGGVAAANKVATNTTGVFEGLGVGEYAVIVTDNDGCKDTTDASHSITTYPSFNLALNVSGPLCQEANSSLVFDATVNNMSADNVFLWANSKEELKTATPTADATQTCNFYGKKDLHQTWFVVANDKNGCTSDTVSASSVIYASPVVSISGADVSLCDNSVINLSAEADSAGYTYSWKLDGVDIAGAIDSTLVVSEGGVYEVTATETHDLITCSATVKTSAITEYTMSDPEFAYTTVCASEDVVLGINSPNADYRYSWYYVEDNGDESKADTAKTSISISAPDTTIKLYSYYEPVLGKGVCVKSFESKVEFLTLPSFSLSSSGDSTVFCSYDQTKQLIAQDVPQDAVISWSRNTEPFAAGDTILNLTEVGKNDTYYAKVTAKNGCETTKGIGITLNQSPIISALDDTAHICYDSAYVVAPNIQFADSYVWQMGDSIMTGETGSSLEAFVNRDGLYKVTVTNADNCTVSDSIQILYPTDKLAYKRKITNESFDGSVKGTAQIALSGGWHSIGNGEDGYRFCDRTKAVTTGVPCDFASATVVDKDTLNGDQFTEGSYSYIFYDANACRLSVSITINKEGEFTILPSHTDVLCNCESNGTISVKAFVGGANSTDYEWFFTDIYGDKLPTSQTYSPTDKATNLAPGTYYVSACRTDIPEPNRVCAKAAIKVVIKEPEKLQITSLDFANASASCPDYSKAVATVSGGKDDTNRNTDIDFSSFTPAAYDALPTTASTEQIKSISGNYLFVWTVQSGNMASASGNSINFAENNFEENGRNYYNIFAHLDAYDKNGCKAQSPTDLASSEPTVSIICANMKDVDIPLGAGCVGDTSFTLADLIKDNALAPVICAPFAEYGVAYSTDGGNKYTLVDDIKGKVNIRVDNTNLRTYGNPVKINWLVFPFDVANPSALPYSGTASPAKVYKVFTADGLLVGNKTTNWIAEECVQNFYAGDVAAPSITDLSGDDSKVVVRYSDDKTTSCSASYSQTYQQISDKLNIKSCVATSISYIVRDTSGAPIIGSPSAPVPLADGDVIDIEDMVRGNYMIEYIVSDGTHPSVSTTQTILVIDDIAPETACMSDITVPLKSSTECTAETNISYSDFAFSYLIAKEVLNADSTPNASYTGNIKYALSTDGRWVEAFTDDCGDTLSLNYQTSSMPTSSVLAKDESFKVSVEGIGGKETIKWTLEDFSHNVSTPCITNVAAIDTSAPIINGKLDTLRLLAEDNTCSGIARFSHDDMIEKISPIDCDPNLKLYYSVTDSLGNTTEVKPLTSTTNNINFSDGDVINWIVKDASGNEAEIKQPVQVTDITAPIVDCDKIFGGDIVADEDFFNTGACATVSDLTQIGFITSIDESKLQYISDNCTPASQITYSATRIVNNKTYTGDDVFNNPFEVGRHIIDWNFTDAQGNSTSCPQSLIVENNEPKVSCEPSTVYVPIDPDNCMLTFTFDSDTVLDGMRRRVLISMGILDIDGNILDPSYSQADIDSMLLHTDCGSKLSITAKVNGQPVKNGYQEILQEKEKLKVEYEIKDEQGNIVICERTYIASDLTPPSLAKTEVTTIISRQENCRAEYANTKDDVISEFGAFDCSDISVYYAYASEYSDTLTFKKLTASQLKKTYSELQGDTIIWKFEDKNKNIAIGKEYIEVIDDIPPVILCPTAPIPVYLDGDCNAEFNLTSNRVLADLRADLVLTHLPNGEKYVGKDESYYDAAQMELITRDCDDLVVSVADASGAQTPLSSQKLEFTSGSSYQYDFVVTDASGNPVSCTVTYEAVDTVAPKITPMQDVVIYQEPGDCDVAYKTTLTEVTKKLNPIEKCGDVKITYSIDERSDTEITATDPLDIQHINSGDTIRIKWTVEDESGNKTSTSHIVTSIDTIPPMIDCAPFDAEYKLVLTETGQAATIEKFKEIGFNPDTTYKDECGRNITPVFVRPDSLPLTATFPLDTTITLKVIFFDEAGNQKVCEQDLTIIDSVPPTITCPLPMTEALACDDDPHKPWKADNISDFVQYLGGSVTDERNILKGSFTAKDSVVGNSCDHTVYRIYSIKDRFGGSRSCITNFGVKDSLPPVWTSTLQDDRIQTYCENVSVSLPVLTAEDACSGVATVSYEEFSTRGDDPTKCDYYNYDITYKFYATDGCANSTPDSLSFVVEVRDTAGPTFSLPDNFVNGIVSVGYERPCIFTMPDITIYPFDIDDNCEDISAITVSQYPPFGDTLTQNVIARLIVSDACGNKVEYEKEITVPSSKSVVSITADDIAVCEGEEEDQTLASIITTSGSLYIFKYGEYANLNSIISYDVYRDKIDEKNLIYSTNPYTYLSRFRNLTAEDLAAIINIDNPSKNGLYYYVAMDTVARCTDTTSVRVKYHEFPRVVMSDGFVEACENQSLPIHGEDGDYTDIYNVCVDGMGLPIIEQGWLLGGKPYNGEPITFERETDKLVYYAANACGSTRSDSSRIWSCDYSFNPETGEFDSDLTTEQMLTDSSSSALGLHIREQLRTDGLMLATNLEGKDRVWVGDPVDLEVITHYHDDVEFHWYKVNGFADAAHAHYDNFGNIIDGTGDPYGDTDEEIAVTHIEEWDAKHLHINLLSDTTQYYVVVTDNICSSAPSNILRVDLLKDIPTAITPHNSVGMNDHFMKGFPVQIFDRYGHLLFQGDDGWDGMIEGDYADPAVYFYVLNFRDGSQHKGTIEVVYFR